MWRLKRTKKHAEGEQKLKSAVHYFRAFYKKNVKSGVFISIDISNGNGDPFDRAVQSHCKTVSKTEFVEAMEFIEGPYTLKGFHYSHIFNSNKFVIPLTKLYLIIYKYTHK